MRTCLQAAAALMALATLGWTPRAEALQMELTRSQLCGISDAVVIGHVADMETMWAGDERGGLERRAAVSVERTLHGKAPLGLDLVLPGGELGEYRHWVEDVPHLKVGTRYMLFVEQTDTGWQVLGGESGAVPVLDTSTKGEPVEALAKSLGSCHAK